MKKYCLAIAAGFLMFIQAAHSQNNWQNWNTAQLDLELTKKLDIRFSHLRSFDLAGQFTPLFNQSSVHIDYDLTKKLSVSAGATVSGSLSAAESKNRITLKLGYKTRIADFLSWSNSIQAELHDVKETRYRQRIIYTTRLSPRKRLDFLNLSPAVSYSLFYNIGGNPVQYYDLKTGTPSVKQTADGFHRGRLMFSLNSKISKFFSLSLYYMHQQEFNLFSSPERSINVINPTTGKTARPFDNFNVAGLTLLFNLSLHKK